MFPHVGKRGKICFNIIRPWSNARVTRHVESWESGARGFAREIVGLLVFLIRCNFTAGACTFSTKKQIKSLNFQLVSRRSCISFIIYRIVTFSLNLIMLRSHRMQIHQMAVKYSAIKARQKTAPKTGNFSSRSPRYWTRFACSLCHICRICYYSHGK